MGFNKKEESSLTHERTQDYHHEDSYMNLQVLAPLILAKPISSKIMMLITNNLKQQEADTMSHP